MRTIASRTCSQGWESASQGSSYCRPLFGCNAARLANLIIPSTITIAGASSADVRGMRIELANVPIIHVPSITADKLIISNPLAAAWFEDGPFQVSAEDVAHLGRDVAFWSLGAGARFIPAGIVEAYDVTP